MSTGKNPSRQKKRKGARPGKDTGKESFSRAGADIRKKLEIVLKCDTSGCAEAITSSLLTLNQPETEVRIISSGIGSVCKSDVFMAETGSRLIVGFNVGLMPHMEQLAAEHNVEIRLFDVIYRLVEDVGSISRRLVFQEPGEKITGTAKIIALFKSSRKGTIIGCEIQQGRLAIGDRFRIVGTMGVKYVGSIESLHIEQDTVREARTGQQAGIKIRDFNKARQGDLVESFRPELPQGEKPWQPSGRIFYP